MVERLGDSKKDKKWSASDEIVGQDPTTTTEEGVESIVKPVKK